MNVYEVRSELRRMNKGDLFKLVSNQRILRCLIGGGACGFLFRHRGFNFCILEIFGQSCQVERSEKSEDRYGDLGEIIYPLPLMQRPGTVPLGKEKRNVQFRVYCRDNVTRSMSLLGKVIERRTKERGKNLKDLLVKAVKDYSNCIADPSAIFLLSL
jgi:hypothetical protein